jgi:hypothetical protein
MLLGQSRGKIWIYVERNNRHSICRAFTTVGHVTLTAIGTFSGAQTTSIAGNFFDETVSGTYTVNSECTGTAVVNVYHGATLARTTNLNLVWDDNQEEVRAIFLTPGTAITINGRKMFHEEEDDYLLI